MIWWLPIAAAQCAVIMHARAMLNSAPSSKEYKKVETSSSTDDDDIEASLVSLEPKLADPVAEQNRLLRERPIYAEDLPQPPHPKLVDLSVATIMAVDAPEFPPQSFASAIPHEPVGQLAFQQLNISEPCSDSGNDTFEASVAKAMEGIGESERSN